MSKIMNQRAITIKATSASRSSDVVKTISKGEFFVLDKLLRPILRENDAERIASEYAVHGLYIGTVY